MAISDEKRREVAARLAREAQAWRGTFPNSECADINAAAIMQDLCVFVGLGRNALCSEVFQRLADLIDRPTCRNIGDDYMFKCSECGAEFEPVTVNGNEYGEVFYTPLKPLYCSACGAEVVE